MQTERKKEGVGLSILNKVEFNVKNIKQEKQQHYNDKKHNLYIKKYPTVTNLQTPNNEAANDLRQKLLKFK